MKNMYLKSQTHTGHKCLIPGNTELKSEFVQLSIFPEKFSAADDTFKPLFYSEKN